MTIAAHFAVMDFLAVFFLRWIYCKFRQTFKLVELFCILQLIRAIFRKKKYMHCLFKTIIMEKLIDFF